MKGGLRVKEVIASGESWKLEIDEHDRERLRGLGFESKEEQDRALAIVADGAQRLAELDTASESDWIPLGRPDAESFRDIDIRRP